MNLLIKGKYKEIDFLTFMVCIATIITTCVFLAMWATIKITFISLAYMTYYILSRSGIRQFYEFQSPVG